MLAKLWWRSLAMFQNPQIYKGIQRKKQLKSKLLRRFETIVKLQDKHYQTKYDKEDPKPKIDEKP